MENIRDFEIKHINEKVLQITYTGKNSKIDKCINELSDKFATFHLVTLLLCALAENTPTSSEQCATPDVSKCEGIEREALLKAFYHYVDMNWTNGMLTDKVDEVIEGFKSL
jgi:hypothetical protein